MRESASYLPIVRSGPLYFENILLAAPRAVSGLQMSSLGNIGGDYRVVIAVAILVITQP